MNYAEQIREWKKKNYSSIRIGSEVIRYQKGFVIFSNRGLVGVERERKESDSATLGGAVERAFSAATIVNQSRISSGALALALGISWRRSAALFLPFRSWNVQCLVNRGSPPVKWILYRGEAAIRV